LPADYLRSLELGDPSRRALEFPHDWILCHRDPVALTEPAIEPLDHGGPMCTGADALSFERGKDVIPQRRPAEIDAGELLGPPCEDGPLGHAPSAGIVGVVSEEGGGEVRVQVD